MGKNKLVSILLFILAIGLFITFFIYRNNQEYLIVFNTNGGTIVENQKVKYHKNVVKPADPTRNGYTFLGWQKDGAMYDFNSLVEENMQLTASWKEITKYKVTVTLEGISYETSVYENKTVSMDDLLLPAKDGYKIVLYNGEMVFNINTPITSNLNLSAKYEITS